MSANPQIASGVYRFEAIQEGNRMRKRRIDCTDGGRYYQAGRLPGNNRELLELSFIRIRDSTQQTVSDNDKRVALGIIARLDIMEAKAQLASRDERVLAATNSVTRAKNPIKQLIFNNA